MQRRACRLALSGFSCASGLANPMPWFLALPCLAYHHEPPSDNVISAPRLSVLPQLSIASVYECYCPLFPSISLKCKYTDHPPLVLKMSSTFTTLALVSSTFFTAATSLPWFSKSFNRQHYSPPANVPANLVPFNPTPAPYISGPELTTNFPDPV